MEQSAALLFASEGSRDYGAHVAARLEAPLIPHGEREFEDGEHKVRPLVDEAAGFGGIGVGDAVRSEAEVAGLLPENVTILDTSGFAAEAIALTHAGF